MDRSLLLSKKGAVLLVIDIQEKFRNAVPRFDDIVENIVRLVLTFQMYDMPIMVTEQYPAGLGPTVEPVRKLFPFLEVIGKMEFAATDSAHFWPQVSALKADSFVVCGIETHVCINQTVIKLIEKGMRVHVVADAVGSRNSLDHNVALRKMERAGAYIATTEMCLFELTEKAGTESFKNIQRMVKGKLTVGRLQKPMGAAAPHAVARVAEEQTIKQPDIMEEASIETAGKSLTDVNADEQKKQSPGADEVLEMIDTVEPAAASAPEETRNTAAEVAQADALLETIDVSGAGAKAAAEKSEAEIDKDIKDIDALLGNLGLTEGEAK